MSRAPASPAGPSRTYDAIVVGAGIIGCAISLELGRAGRRVLCVDAGPAAGSGSTGASSAIVRFHYSDAIATTVAWDSYFDWKAWPDYVDLPRSEPLASYVIDRSPGPGRARQPPPGDPRPLRRARHPVPGTHRRGYPARVSRDLHRIVLAA